MKELSIEEKAKAYDEAIDKIADVVEAGTIEQGLAEWLFPELKKSEDERIRKELLDYFKNKFKKYPSDHKFSVWIAWLEKQGEHANFRNKIQIGDKVTRNEDGVLVNLSQLNRVAKKDEKQGEQKLDRTFVNVDDVREDFVNEVYRVLDADSTNDRANQIIDAFDNLPTVAIEKQGEQMPAWSEEFIAAISRAISIVKWAAYSNHSHPILNDEGATELVERLNFIKERVQPRQKWSEEDEKNFARVDYACLKVYGGDSYSSDWLRKFLGIHKKWKPSNEQIMALR
jgi:hypothetical protein